MNIDFSILMAIIGFSAFVAVLGFWMQKKDEQTVIPALSLFVSASLFFFLFAGIDNVTMGSRIDNIVATENTFNVTTSTFSVPDYSYNVFTGTNVLTIRADGSNNHGFSEHATSNSILIGEEIECLALPLIRVGSPTGNAIIGIFDVNGGIKQQFGTIDVSTIPLSITWFEFCLSGDNAYNIVSNDRMGIMWLVGTSDASNFIRTVADTGNPFDGDNTLRNTFTVSWGSTAGQDINMQMYKYIEIPNDVQVSGIGGVYTYEHEIIEMSELKYYFLVIATFLMLTAVYSVKLYKGQGSGEYIDSL